MELTGDGTGGQATAPAGPRIFMLSRIADVVQEILSVLVGVGMLVLFGSVIVQVGGRYLFQYAPVWSEVLAGYLVVWVSFLGTAWLTRAGLHLTVSLVPDALGRRMQMVVELVGLGTFGAFAGAMLVAGLEQYELTIPMMSFGLDISASWLYLSVPVSAACILLFLLERLAIAAMRLAQEVRR